MDETTRRQITWILVIAVALCLIIYGTQQSAVIPQAVETLATGTLPQQMEVADLLVSRGMVAEALDGQPRWVQTALVKALLLMGTPEALQQLVEATPKLDEPVADWAGQGLTGLGGLAVGPLVECLQNKDDKVRAAAEAPLEKLGGPAVIAAVTPLMGAYDDFVRGSVTNVFAKLPDLASPVAVQMILRETPAPGQTSAAFSRAQSESVEILVAMGKPALDPVTKELAPSRTEKVRANAALILGRLVAGLKQDAPLVIPPLVQLAGDPAWSVRGRAATALGELGKDGRRPEVLAALEARLADPPEVKAAAVKSLGLIGDLSAAPALAAVMINSREGADTELVNAFQALGPASLPALGAALGASDPAARELATRAAAAVGTPAAAPVLAARLTDADVQVRRQAALALETLATPAAVPDLARTLGDTDGQVYTSAKRALELVGAPAVPAVVAMLGAEPRTALQAEEVLAAIGKPAIPALVSTLRGGNDNARNWAAASLGDIGPEAVVPVAAVAADPSASVPTRAAAAEALGRTGLPAALPALKALASAPDPTLRAAALGGLATTLQEDATTYLVAGLKDPSPAVRLADLPLVEAWQASDVDKQLGDLLTQAPEETQRLAAICLAFHASPMGGAELPGGQLETPMATGQTTDLGAVLNRTVADVAETPLVRRHALEALAYAGNAQSVTNLLAFLQPGDPLAATAAHALGLLAARLSTAPDAQTAQAAQTAVTQLLGVLQTTPDEALRLQVAAALSLVGEAAVKPLMAAITNAPAATAPWLAATLGAVGKPAVAELIREGERKNADKFWVGVAAGLTNSPDADRFLAAMQQEDKPSDAMVAQGRDLYEQIATARRPAIS